MGDISAEPSMEDILSSIKRIIAEEGDAAVAARGARRPAPIRAPQPMPRADIDDFGHDEILELSDPVRAAVAQPAAPAHRAEPPRVEPARVEPVASQATAPVLVQTAAPVVEEAVATSDTIISAQATQATRGPLEALSRMVVKPEISGADTLEGMVREMLRPMLRDWLDAHLPGLVEQMVAKEIARITGQH